MAALFFRLIAPVPYVDGPLSLSFVHLYNGEGRIDDGAVVTATVAPEEGSVGNLQSGGVCTWGRNAIRQSGFAIVWAFPAPVEVVTMQVGATENRGEFLSDGVLQWSEDGVTWGGAAWFGRLPWPGENQPSGTFQLKKSVEKIGMGFDGPAGTSNFVDQARNPMEMQVVGSVALATIGSISAARFTGGRIFFGVTPDTSLILGGEDFCIHARVFDAGSGNRRTLFGNSNSIGGASTLLFSASTSNVRSLIVGSVNVTLPGTTPVGVWYHLAITRRSGVVKVFINGALLTTFSQPNNVGAGGGRFSLGSAGNYDIAYGGPSGLLWMGDVDFFEVILGDSVFDEPFTPPTGLLNVFPFIKIPARGIASEMSAAYGAAQAVSEVLPTTLGDAIADLECGGQRCIYGTVELYAPAGNIPLPRRVRLHRSRDGLLVREAWSDVQGNYRFDGITERYTYDVIAWDHEGLQQSVVANDLTPEVMQ